MRGRRWHLWILPLLAAPLLALALIPAFRAALGPASSAPGAIDLAPAPGPTATSDPATAVEWRPLFKGIELASVRASQPRPLRVYAARIDLQAPGLRFLVTPPAGPMPRPLRSTKTSTFLSRTGCQLAINLSPYGELSDVEGTPMKLHGLGISQGKDYGKPNPYFGALFITRDNRASLLMPPYDTKGAFNAAGGFRMLVVDGAPIELDDELHPRTAIGLSRDGRRLLLVVVDGRQPGWSEGVTSGELAHWMIRLGAWRALNFDGGGSSTMVMQDPGGKPKLINTPVHRGIPGMERPIANCLGIFAEPLP